MSNPLPLTSYVRPLQTSKFIFLTFKVAPLQWNQKMHITDWWKCMSIYDWQGPALTAIIFRGFGCQVSSEHWYTSTVIFVVVIVRGSSVIMLCVPHKSLLSCHASFTDRVVLHTEGDTVGVCSSTHKYNAPPHPTEQLMPVTDPPKSSKRRAAYLRVINLKAYLLQQVGRHFLRGCSTAPLLHNIGEHFERIGGHLKRMVD